MDKLEHGDIGGYIDLESGWRVREERSKDSLPANAPKKKSLKRAFGGVLRFEGSGDIKSGVANSTLRYGEAASDRFADRFLRENRPLNIPYLDKMQQKEKHQKTNSRKPPKPPRPPKPILSNDADRKLAKDAAEMAIRKRACIEQMRAQKKKGAANASTSSSSSSIIALFITVLFFIIMLYQGITRNSLSYFWSA